MPIYEYQCQKCDERFEVMQRISDDTLESCPKDKCPRKGHGKGSLTKLISKTSFALKGGGWAKDGYGSG
jgi:putative FmdB family regulatory protein